jgi:hypothetical protein
MHGWFEIGGNDQTWRDSSTIMTVRSAHFGGLARERDEERSAFLPNRYFRSCASNKYSFSLCHSVRYRTYRLPEIFYRQGEQDGSGDHLFSTFQPKLTRLLYPYMSGEIITLGAVMGCSTFKLDSLYCRACIGLRQFATCGNMPH